MNCLFINKLHGKHRVLEMKNEPISNPFYDLCGWRAATGQWVRLKAKGGNEICEKGRKNAKIKPN